MKNILSKETYYPKIKLKKREDKISIWVNMPNGEDYNIWDLKESEINDQVIKCIASSFDRGIKAMKMMIDSIRENIILSFPEYDMKLKEDMTKKRRNVKNDNNQEKGRRKI